MTKRNLIYITILILLFSLYVLFEFMTPKPINWTPSFSEKDKIPYGCFVLKKTIPDLFKNQQIEDNTNSFCLSFSKENNKTNSNLIIITNSVKPDNLDLEQLLEYVSSGNCVFIASMDFGEKFMDTLNFGVSKDFFYTLDISEISGRMRKRSSLSDSNISFNFVNPALKKSGGYKFKHNIPHFFFCSFDTLNTIVLGTFKSDHVNYMKVNFGSGCFYINCQPLLFTNHSILYGDYEYVYNALSYIPVRRTIWDEYYKPGNKKSASPIRYILSSNSLKTAYYLLLFSIIAYVIFRAKRRQRIIPVIKPNSNISLEFVETIGRLYYHRKEHKDIALKRYTYLLEFINSRYYLKTDNLDNNFFQILSDKTGAELSLIAEIFGAVGWIKEQISIYPDDLSRINLLIDEFYDAVL